MKTEIFKGAVTAGYLKKMFKEQNVPDEAIINIASPKEQILEQAVAAMFGINNDTKKPEVILMSSLKGLI